MAGFAIGDHYLFTFSFFKPGWLFLFIAIDLIISVNFVIPVTGLSRTPPAVYNRSAKEFYTANTDSFLLKPELRSEALAETDITTAANAVKLVPRFDFPSHTNFDSYINYIEDSSHRKQLLSLPFAFSDDGTQLKIEKFNLGYNHINIDLYASDTCNLVIQQAYYRRWKNEEGHGKVYAYEGVLLQTPLKKGFNKVRLSYYFNNLLVESIIAFVSLLFAVVYILTKYWKQTRHEQ